MRASRETVFVVDDEPAVLKSFSRLLRSAGFHAVAFGSPEEFLDQLDPNATGCLILDVSMPGLDGLALQEALSSRGFGLPILFVTGHGNIPGSVQAMKRGAVDFLTKPVDDAVFLQAVRLALEKERARWRVRSQVEEVRRRLSSLTPREREVLEGVVAGQLNKQIAGHLGAAEKTVKVHRARVMAKMAASSVADLVRLTDRARIRKT